MFIAFRRRCDPEREVFWSFAILERKGLLTRNPKSALLVERLDTHGEFGGGGGLTGGMGSAFGDGTGEGGRGTARGGGTGDGGMGCAGGVGIG